MVGIVAVGLGLAQLGLGVSLGLKFCGLGSQQPDVVSVLFSVHTTGRFISFICVYTLSVDITRLCIQALELMLG